MYRLENRLITVLYLDAEYECKSGISDVDRADRFHQKATKKY